jgi:GntR family transcriptional regulator/MocR family aminotransferase
MSTNASVRKGATEPFRPGVPALDLFPIKLWSKYLQDASSASYQNLSYGAINSQAALRRSIASYLGDAPRM